MLCGRSYSSGYEHISANHSGQWQQRLNQVGAYDTNWAQFMMWTTRQAAGRPYYGFPRYSQTTQKFCYTTPVDMRRAGKKPIRFNPSIIISINNRTVITSYPSTNVSC